MFYTQENQYKEVDEILSQFIPDSETRDDAVKEGPMP